VKQVDNKKKLMTAREVQAEYLNMDVRKLRAFLNKYCSYSKIGKNYFYLRKEVEELLCNDEESYEFIVKDYN
jgi:hypothetical protein